MAPLALEHICEEISTTVRKVSLHVPGATTKHDIFLPSADCGAF